MNPHRSHLPLVRNPKIISGRWKGRSIPLPKAQYFRPTLTRVRQRVFDWLRGYLTGMSVLDLYAGSGALGFEALSQGAQSLTLVEQDPLLSAALRHFADQLSPHDSEICVICQDALQFLAHSPKQPYDLVLLDPPFEAGALPSTIHQLLRSHWLASDAFIYCEYHKQQEPLEVPTHWRKYRSGGTDQTRFVLFQTAAV